MARVQRLQQVEGLGAADLTNEDAIGSVPQCCAKQICDGDWWQRCLLSKRCLRAAGLQPPDDVHASAEYRRHLAEVLAVRAVRAAKERAS